VKILFQVPDITWNVAAMVGVHHSQWFIGDETRLEEAGEVAGTLARGRF